MSAFNDISVALNQRLQSYATTNSREVAYENIAFEPTVGTMYIRPTVLPATTEQAGIGSSGKDRYLGVFQVDIFAAIDEPKAIVLNEADNIADYFAPNTTLTYNGVNVDLMSASIGRGNRERSWYMLPIFVNYSSFTRPR